MTTMVYGAVYQYYISRVTRWYIVLLLSVYKNCSVAKWLLIGRQLCPIYGTCQSTSYDSVALLRRCWYVYSLNGLFHPVIIIF